MSAKSKSQISEVIGLLILQGYITFYESIEKFCSTRLSGIIFILRERGFGIDTEMVQGKNRYGHSTNYAIYRLTKDIEEVEE